MRFPCKSIDNLLLKVLLAFLPILGAIPAARGQNFADNRPATPGITAGAREIPWANPLAGGKIRAVLAAPVQALPDAAQLARHLEVNLELVPLFGAFDDGATDVTDHLSAALPKRFDVVIVGNSNRGVIDVERLRAAYGKAFGVVIVRFGDQAAPTAIETEPVDPSVITRGVGMDLWPHPERTHPEIHASIGASGRMVDIHYPSPPAATQALVPPAFYVDEVDWTFSEAHWALVTRAVRWAADREPPVVIRGIAPVGTPTPNLDEVPPFLPQEYVENLSEQIAKPALRPFEVTFIEPTDRRYNLRYRARYPYRDISAWTYPLSETVPKGVKSHVVNVPIGNGDVFLDLWLDDRRDTVDWFSAALQLDAWPEIDTFRCVPNVVMANGSVTAEFRVRGHFQQPRPATAYVTAKDAYGRLLADRYVSVPEDGGDIAAELAFTDAMGTYVHVEVYVADRPKPPFTLWELERAAYRGVYVPLRDAADPAFTFMADGLGAAETNAHAVHDRLRAQGVNRLHVEPSWDRVAPGAFLSNLPMLPHVASYRATSGVGGLERSPCLTDPAFINDETDRVQQFATALRPYGGSFYSLGDGNCIVANADELCRSETCMDSFAKYLARSYDDLGALNAAWGMAFDSFDAASRYVPSASPDAPAAPWLDFRRYTDGVLLNAHIRAANAVRLVDADAQVGFCSEGMTHPQAGLDWSALATRLDLLIAPTDAPIFETIAGAMHPKSRVLLRCDASEIEAAGRWAPWHAALHGLHGVYAPEAYALSAFGEPEGWLAALGESVRALQAGFADVLQRAEPRTADVVVVSSQSSRYLRANRDDTDPDAATRAWIEALRASGIAYRVIADDALDAHALADARAVLLPANEALPTNAAAALGAFHANGGTVIAGDAPGTLDAHGAPRSTPLGFSATTVDDAASLASALTAAEIMPIAHDTADIDSDFHGERALVRYGAADVYVFLQSADASARRARIAVQAPDGGHSYALTETEQFPGRRKSTLHLEPGAAGIVAVLPYEVARVQIDGPEIVEAGKRINLHLSVRTFDKLPGAHLVHIGIAPVAGELIRHYDRVVECPGGQGDAYIPVALNEWPGIYEVRVRDVLSGVSATHQVVIEGRPLLWP